MGDLSDLPNFSKRPWYRRKKTVRIFMVAMGAVIGAVAWCVSAVDPAQDLTIEAQLRSTKAAIGSPYTVQAVVKNSGDRSATIHLQMALFVKQSICLEAGQRVPNSFSQPMTLSVAPNDRQIVQMQFDAITSPCAGTAGIEVFADGKMDLDRFSFSRKLDNPAVSML
jgi:hypothetical protein